MLLLWLPKLATRCRHVIECRDLCRGFTRVAAHCTSAVHIGTCRPWGSKWHYPTSDNACSLLEPLKATCNDGVLLLVGLLACCSCSRASVILQVGFAAGIERLGVALLKVANRSRRLPAAPRALPRRVCARVVHQDVAERLAWPPAASSNRAGLVPPLPPSALAPGGLTISPLLCPSVDRQLYHRDASASCRLWARCRAWARLAGPSNTSQLGCLFSTLPQPQPAPLHALATVLLPSTYLPAPHCAVLQTSPPRASPASWWWPTQKMVVSHLSRPAHTTPKRLLACWRPF